MFLNLWFWVALTAVSLLGFLTGAVLLSFLFNTEYKTTLKNRK